jgi:RNA polymerase sigma factor (sigma-70 family)
MSDIALPADGVPGLPHSERLLGDELLAKLAGKGSGRAFRILYERHHQAIYRYCRSILGNDHDAQEALQSTMMRAYAALARQQRELAVKAWLFRIAHNEAISILRRRRPEQELASDLESVRASVEDTLEGRERLATLVADLRSLPERQRAALLMRELSGLSIRELAAALSISEGAAKQTLFEARSSLHELSQGRAMDCEAVRQAISQRDGRVLRGRRIRAHLHACEDCQTFREAIGSRQAELRALAPAMPVPAATAVLAKLLTGGAAGHMSGTAVSGAAVSGTAISGSAIGGTAAVGLGASLGGSVAGSLLAKGVVGVAIMGAATAGAIHLASSSSRHPPSPTKAADTVVRPAGSPAGKRVLHGLPTSSDGPLTTRASLRSNSKRGASHPDLLGLSPRGLPPGMADSHGRDPLSAQQHGSAVHGGAEGRPAHGAPSASGGGRAAPRSASHRRPASRSHTHRPHPRSGRADNGRAGSKPPARSPDKAPGRATPVRPNPVPASESTDLPRYPEARSGRSTGSSG